MARFSPLSFILLLLALVQSNATQNQKSRPTQAPAPQMSTPNIIPSCDILMFKMIDCLPYISNRSIMAKPVESCCSGFLEVWKLESNCVCEALNGSVVLGFQLNMTRAVHVSSACGFQDVSLDKCLASPPAQIIKPSPAQAMATSDADSSSSILSILICMCFVVLFIVAFNSREK